MHYQSVTKGIFILRENRFVAKTTIDGKECTVHVKNTGRCKELLTPGAEVYLEKSSNPARATAYDLIAVNKNGMLINMDSQAPNKAADEFFRKGGIFHNLESLTPEKTFGSSRFDFYGVHGGKEFFAEVKGVTLEENGVVRFPDAPTKRGAKHLRELAAAVRAGYEAYVIFVVQMSGVKYFSPNSRTDPDFAQALREAANSGVHILCFDCKVTPDSMEISRPLEVRL